MLSRIKSWIKHVSKQVKKKENCGHSTLVKSIFNDRNYNMVMSDKGTTFATSMEQCPECKECMSLLFNDETFKNYKPSRTW